VQASPLVFYMSRILLDPSKLPSRKSGFTVAELAKHFETSVSAIHTWLSSMKTGKRVNAECQAYTVKRVRVEDRFLFLPRGKKK